jgi:peptidoglycan/LPS O-acetylase OafA/YrhL
MTPTAHPSYRPEIDGLRAVAILLVAVFHFRLLPMGEAGFIGVDIFFVISGYLITGLLMRDLDLGRMSLGRFYLARLRRLMPALLATLVLYMLVAVFVFLPERLAELAREALLTQLYVINIYFWRTINYFGLQAEAVPLLHMWSLAVEEQFYLVYPLLLALAFRMGRGAVLPVIAVITAGSFVLGLWATGWKPQASFYLLPTRAWELGAGAVLALLPRQIGSAGARVMAGLAGVALIALALVIHTPITPFPGWFAALPVAGAALLILSGPDTPTGRVLSLRPMLWIGWISYPFYLVHWPVIQLLDATLPEVLPRHSWAGFAGSIVISWAIWRFVETPIRTGAILKAPRRMLAGLGGATAVLSAVTLAGLITGGFPARLSEPARAMLAYAHDKPAPFVTCEIARHNPAGTPCPLGDPAHTPSVVVIGDSHAQAMAGAFDQWLQDVGRAGELWFHHGCLPVPGAGRDCQPFLSAAMDRIAGDPAIDHVLLVSAWRHDPNVYDGAYVTGDAADAALTQALEQGMEALAAPGRRLVLVDPMFAAAARVPERLAQNLYFGRDLPVDTPAAEHAATFTALHGIFDRVAARPDVMRLSLIEALCASGSCSVTLDGAPLFTDSNHVRFGSAGYFAGVLAQQLTIGETTAHEH